MNKKTVIILAPHPDDGEFGAGATIKKWTNKGHSVHYVAFSPCITSLPDGMSENTLFKELRCAAEILGIPESNITTFNFPVRRLNEHRQDILEELINLRKKINPDIVLLPNSTDVHQDHQCIHNEGIRAYKHSCILGYELPWNDLSVTTNFHVKVSESDINAKANAIAEYKSQQFRNYASEEFLLGLARVRGTQISEDYAEGFELIRWIER